MIERATRTGGSLSRRALWRSVWGLEYVPPKSAHRLVGWLDRLSDVSYDEWLAITHAARHDPLRPERLGAAQERLEAVVSEHRLELVAWFVRDMVDTAVYHALHRDEGRDRASRVAASVARDAAYLAGLAIAARTWLTDRDYHELSAPFAIVIGT